MKKMIFFVAALTLVIQLVSVPRSNAGIGGLVTLFGGGAVGVPLMVTGGAITGVSTVIFLSNSDNPESGWLNMYLAIGGFFVGLVILDESDAVTAPKYTILNTEQAKKIGLSSEELIAYNNDIDEINAEAQVVTKALVEKEKPSLEDARELWARDRDMFSPVTMSAVEKVSQYLHRSIYEKAVSR